MLKDSSKCDVSVGSVHCGIVSKDDDHEEMISIQQQQEEEVVVDENMSNLTSASGEASVSCNQQFNSFASPNPNPTRKKRNQPGNPDPEAEVMALSPKTLMTTNRFVCEICGKGFKRDQNLQLHRRGHNLPWKLKRRSSKEAVCKKVYVCPEASCVHHDPARALGDLTGIKKHFSRKHGEKKWKCDKCSKKYAVQSDWKAHSKVCGTREYRCDCGTLFSRRDSFITHRAFCDALAEESARAIAAVNHQNPLLFPQSIPLYDEQQLSNSLPHTDQAHNHIIPPWLSATSLNQYLISQPQFTLPPSTSSPIIFSAGLMEEQPVLAPAPFQASAHMSATALLQKAAEMGANMSTRPPGHLGLMAAAATASSITLPLPHLPLVQEYMATTATNALLSSTVMPGSKKEPTSLGMADQQGGRNGDGMTTRDFLGLKAAPFPHRDFHNFTELDPNCTFDQYQQRRMKPWHGMAS